jgi:hypothetical protein
LKRTAQKKVEGERSQIQIVCHNQHGLGEDVFGVLHHAMDAKPQNIPLGE